MRKIKNVDFFDYLFQLSLVKRWADFSTKFEDTSASHSYRVAAFGILAGQIEREYHHRDINMKKLLGKALFGNLNEAFTNSLRHNTKKHPLVKELITKLEHEASISVLHSFSDPLREEFKDLVVNAEDNTIEGRLVRDLGTLDALFFAYREVKASNFEPFASIYDNCRQRLMESEFESIRFLIDEFENEESDTFSFLSAIMYMNRIQRWAGRFSLTLDTDATHMFRAAAMGYFLSEYENIHFGANNNTYLCVGKILLHDLIECITSDLPSPFKKKNIEFADAFETYENIVAENFVECTPLLVRPYISKVLIEPKDSTREGELVDIVDKMDPLLKALKEIHLNVSEYTGVYTNQLNKLQVNYYNRESVQYFLGMVLPNLIFEVES